MRASSLCRDCLFTKNIGACPPTAEPGARVAWQEGVRRLTGESGELSAPEIVERLEALRRGLFGEGRDFGPVKRHFNGLMLSLLPWMEAQVGAAADPLKRAVQLALAANYIDFGALSRVDEAVLLAQLKGSGDIAPDPAVLEAFRREALQARRIVVLTDNCGEIVADRLLISVLRGLNPGLWVTAVVRGQPVLNDATLEDAWQVELGRAAQCVIGSGRAMPGSVIGAMSAEAEEEIRRADLLLAKGQGNCEGLSGCGLNVFYLFLCKCELFAQRYQVPLYTGIMAREPRPGD